MAIEWHYVSSDGTDTWANSTSSSTPCSLDTALANVAAGIGLYLKAGTYTRTATDTIGASGTATSPILMVGCDASWNVLTPSRNATTKLLDTTNYPILAYDAGYRWYSRDYSFWFISCIYVTGSVNSSLLYMGPDSIIYGSKIVNTINSSGAISLYVYTYCTADNCDIALVGSTGSRAVLMPSYARLINSIIYESSNIGIEIAGSASVVINTLIYGHAGYGVYMNISNTSLGLLYGVTIYGGKGFGTSDTAFTRSTYIGCCHITDGSEYAFYNPNATGSPLFLSHNRTRDNSSGLISWAGDGVFNVGGYNSDTGDASDDFKDYANDNFALKLSAIGASLGQFGQPVGPLPPPDKGVSKSRVFGGL